MAVAVKTRLTVLVASRAALLTGPAVLAFFTGGFFDEARNWAGLAAWLIERLMVEDIRAFFRELR